MSYVDPETVEHLRQIDLLTYLRACEPEELVRVSGTVYATKTHDSLKISNGKWMWWSRGIGGYGALDYLIKVRELSFLEAVEMLMKMSSIPIKRESPRDKPADPKALLLPDKNKNTDRVIRYLTARGIHRAVLDYFLDEEMIYESLPYHNVVFVGYDREHRARYAAFRATNASRVMGDCSGSDKHYSFQYSEGTMPRIHVFESAIDLLSYVTLCQLKGIQWRKYNFLSLAGVYKPKENIRESKVPAALQTFLKAKPDVKEIQLHLDNDEAGRLASRALESILSDRCVRDAPPPQGKDVNDYLMLQLGKQPMEYQKKKGCERI